MPDQSPLAVQTDGLLLADQLRVALPPVVTDIGLALSDTTGGACTVIVLLTVAL